MACTEGFLWHLALVVICLLAFQLSVVGVVAVLLAVSGILDLSLRQTEDDLDSDESFLLLVKTLIESSAHYLILQF